MITVSELALFLKTSAARAKGELTSVTREYLDDVKQDARALIGQERPEWADLAASTVAEKSRLGYGGQVSSTDPLLRTGEMRESIRSEAGASASGAEGSVGSDSKIAVFQEMGTSRIPPRPFLSTALIQGQSKAEVLFGHLGVQLLNPPVR